MRQRGIGRPATLWLGVVEGLLPFVSPALWRGVFERALTLSDGQIRFIGLSSMLAGLLLLAIWR